jgi:hypothetical protein
MVAAMVKGGITQVEAQKMLDSVRTPQPLKDALEAYLDGKPYPVPKNLTFKLKSGTQVSERTLEDLHRGGLREADYTRRTQETAQLRRQLEQRMTQADAQFAAAKERESWLKEREQEMIEAQKDPQKWEQYQETMRLYQSNPAFRKLYDDALSARESKAQLTSFEEAALQREVIGGAEQALGWINELAPQYPTVNPERVRFLYGYALEHGQMNGNTMESVRSVFEGETQYLTSAANPMKEQMDAMRAELDALKAAKETDSHNAHTARVLDRAKAPNTAPGGGGPPAPGRIAERKPIPPDRRAQEEAISAWSKVRDE